MSTSPNDSGISPIENIYLTARVRMQSEIRLKRKNYLVNATNAYYSFLLICVSIPGFLSALNIDIPQSITLVLSIALLVSSIFLQGERYAERSLAFKQSYLEFQTLYHDPSKSENEKMQEYYTKLAICENQSDADCRSAVVSGWLNGKTLKNSDGPIVCTKSIIAKYVFDSISWIAIILIVLLAPGAWILISNG